jgi:hypothetical protein
MDAVGLSSLAKILSFKNCRLESLNSGPHTKYVYQIHDWSGFLVFCCDSSFDVVEFLAVVNVMP